MGDRYCIECGCDHGRAYDPPIMCAACATAMRCAEEHANALEPLRAEIATLRARVAELERCGWVVREPCEHDEVSRG